MKKIVSKTKIARLVQVSFAKTFNLIFLQKEKIKTHRLKEPDKTKYEIHKPILQFLKQQVLF